jgi:hypothetical protein
MAENGVPDDGAILSRRRSRSRRWWRKSAAWIHRKPCLALERACPVSLPDPLSRMNPYVAEIVGTTLLVLLGNGVVANVVLLRTISK